MNQHLLLRRRRRRLSRRAGVTLVEVMIVVVIMALLATAVAVAVFPNLRASRENVTTTSGAAMQQAAILWMSDIANSGCPSVDDLLDADLLTNDNTADGYGNEFTIDCEGNDIVVSSAGEDGQFGTEDDIVVGGGSN